MRIALNNQGLGAMIARLLLILGCAMLAQGCATRGGTVPYDRTDFGTPDVVAVPDSSQGRIGTQDALAIAVLQLPEMDREVTVGANGYIQLPLIGPVQAQGRTVDEVAEEITARLSARYVRKPDVLVSRKQAAAQTVTVEGAVQNPGVFPISGETTLIKAVALARGTSESANPRRVVVFRTIDGKRNAAAFDLTAIRRAQAEDPLIYGNDIIVVDGSVSRSRFKDIVQSIPLLTLFRPF
jgi:polysaccharide export outer membrane protein